MKMRSTIYKSGFGYKTVVPTAWVESLKAKNLIKPTQGKRGKKEVYEVDKVQLGDLLFFSSPFEPFESREIELTSLCSRETDRKMKIVTAYLQGFDAIDLTIRGPGDFAQIEREIGEYIPGTKVEKISNEQFRLILPKEYNRIDEVINSMIRDLFSKLHDILSISLREFNQNRYMIQNRYEEAKKYERELDKMTYVLKHNLYLAISYPELCLRLNITDPKDFIHYSSIISYFERAADLHLDAMQRLKKMSEKKEISWPELEPFRNCYEEAYKILEDAIKGYKDRERRLTVIEGKMGRWENVYKDFYDTSEEIKKWIKEKSDIPPEAVRDLTILEGKIKAIPYIAANICEALYNMDKEILK